MAFTETVYITLEGGIVLPISGVTAEKSTADIVVHDGETYRNLVDAATVGRAWPTLASDYASDKDDRISTTAPRYKAKTRTLWSFTRGTGFTHVVWADLVQGTSPVAPYRIGMTPTAVA